MFFLLQSEGEFIFFHDNWFKNELGAGEKICTTEEKFGDFLLFPEADSYELKDPGENEEDNWKKFQFWRVKSTGSEVEEVGNDVC